MFHNPRIPSDSAPWATEAMRKKARNMSPTVLMGNYSFPGNEKPGHEDHEGDTKARKNSIHF
jgi:hypothetical protein